MKDASEAGSAFDASAQARTPGRDVMGKLDSSIPEVRVPHQARLDGEARAYELGLDLTCFIREIYYEAVYGSEHVASLYKQRMLRASGKAGQSAGIAPPSAGLPTFLRAESAK